MSARDDLIDAYARAEAGMPPWSLAELRRLLDDVAAEAVADAAGKDTRKGESTLNSDVLTFLTTVRDALTVPRIARTGNFEELMERRQRRDELIADRATTVRIAAQVIVGLNPSNLQAHLVALTETIRHGIDAAPVDYEVRQDDEPAGGEQL